MGRNEYYLRDSNKSSKLNYAVDQILAIKIMRK